MTKFKVSIISVYHNRDDGVSESISSILSQEYQNFEIVLVNDGSTDDTLSKLNRYCEYDFVRLIDKPNTGFVDSIIQAINTCESEYIAIHGSGDKSYPLRISKQAEVLDTFESVGVVGCFYENADLVRNYINIFSGESAFVHDANRKLMKSNFFTHGEVMFRASYYRQSGGYSQFFQYSQDYDLWLRLSRICDIYIVPEVLYCRYIREDGVSGSVSKILDQQCFASLARFCNRNNCRPSVALINEFKLDGAFRKRLIKVFFRTVLTGGNYGDMKALDRYFSRCFVLYRIVRRMVVWLAGC